MAPAHGDVHFHDGFFLRMALGYTRLYSRGHHFDASQNAQESTGGGMVAEAALGFTPASGLVVAADITSHMLTSVDTKPSSYDVFARPIDKLRTFSLLCIYYPRPRFGFNAGLGAGGMYGTDYDHLGGFALTTQLGYEWWVGEQWSAGLLARAVFSRLTTTRRRENVALPSLSFVVTYH